MLNDDNALKLFYHSSSLGSKPSRTLEELSRKIVKRCNGFPLAITVIGRSLSGKPIEIWRQREYEWSKESSILVSDSETELFLCLQRSLDALNKRFTIVKECFLDLGAFPEDREIPVAVLIDMWAELHNIDDDSVCFANVYELANRNLANLVDKSGLKMENEVSYNKRFVTQHDLLRELAIYNAKLDPVEERERVIIEITGNNIPKWWREQKNHPIKARLISITTDSNFDMKWPDIQLPKAEVFIFRFQSTQLHFKYPLPEFIEKMNELKVMVIYGSGDCEVINFGLLCLLRNLKRISLHGLSIGFITNKQVQFKSLKKISFQSCDMNRIHKGLFNMSDAFPILDELIIDCCTNLEALVAECGKLIHLRKLSIINCPELCELPKEIGNLANLELLSTRSCSYLSELPNSVRNLKNLSVLDLNECLIIELPEWIGELSSLRKVDMRMCCQMEPLPSSVLGLDHLEEVICDEVNSSLWEPFLSTLTNLSILVIPWS